jgi:hypothetical protein
MRRELLLILAAFFLASCTVSRAEEPVQKVVKPRLRPIISSSISSSSLSSSSSSAASSQPQKLPPAVQLDVPFTSQAPHRNWNQPYQDACEEANLLMVIHYLNDVPFTLESADQEIVSMTAQVEQMGYGLSITMEQLADITRTLYPGYTVTLSTDVTKESIMKLLAQGKPVMVPAAGRMLSNPYYSGEGPWYHMILITGYDGKFFYTNDSGTSYGERYPYPHDVLLNAIHDWTGINENIGEGRKVMMTIEN